MKIAIKILFVFVLSRTPYSVGLKLQPQTEHYLASLDRETVFEVNKHLL